MKIDLNKYSSERKSRLQEVRELRGMSLEELSERSGIPCETLQKIESGKEVSLNSRLIAKLSGLLEVMPSLIFS